jgi:putative transposase
VLQNCADRLIKAYDNFFRRMKLRKRGVKVKAGFPRFKKRWRSITYPQFGFKFLSERRLSVSKIGNIPIILHRPTEGKVKTLTIKRNSVGQWFAMFTCETEKVLETHPHVDKKIGIDLGLESFATLSDGTRVNNPRCLVKTERRLKRMQRKLSRTKKSSNRRWKIHLPGLALQA